MTKRKTDEPEPWPRDSRFARKLDARRRALEEGDVEEAGYLLDDLYDELEIPSPFDLEALDPEEEPPPPPLSARECREARARIEREKSEERAREQARRRARPLFGRGSRGPRRPRP